MNKHEVRKLYEQRGTPDVGVEHVPVDRLFEIAADPRFDAAAEAIRKEQGGLPVAVANAADEVKAAADVVAPSNDDEGVAVAVERYVLEDGSRCGSEH